VLHLVGGFWLLPGTLASVTPVAAYRFAYLGIITELLPWPCRLTLLENWVERRAGIEPYQGGFLLHYLDKIVYLNISANVLTAEAVIVCVFNLAFYARQLWICLSVRD
jgi:hypothetical protein